MYIVTAKEMYEIDQYAMQKVGVDSRLLMENAGRAVAEEIRTLVKEDEKVLILCGGGNNGGDGFVVARTLLLKSYHVEVWQVVSNDKLTAEAKYHKSLFERCGGFVKVVNSPNGLDLSPFETIIDAMLGIGVKGPLRGMIREWVEVINKTSIQKISIDLPTGVPADEGYKVDVAVQADHTIVIQCPKVSLFLQSTAEFYGKWRLVDIGLPILLLEDQLSGRRIRTKKDVQSSLPIRHQFSHKGSHGKGIVIGGSREMPNAPAFSVASALKSGIGLVTIGCTWETYQQIRVSIPEATYQQVDPFQEPSWADFERYGAAAIGMGMGREEEVQKFIINFLKNFQQPLVVDADALFAIANHLDLLTKRSSPTILTPHFGEFARLTGKTVSEIEERPFELSKEFAEKYKVYLVLKGPFTIITDLSGSQWVSSTGNPGLAKGGSGDVLSGIILSMILQSSTLIDAIVNSCWIHGKTADLWLEDGHTSFALTATDLIQRLGHTISYVEKR
ncbi:NAD(P)H-hydrate dehydratase [Bacillaceae bacterium S4-13-58]